MSIPLRIRALAREILAHLPGIGAVVCLILLTALPARSQVQVADYTFASESLASSGANAFSTASHLSVGAGLASVAEFGSIFGNIDYGAPSDSLPLTEALAISGNDYFTITITPTSGSLAFTNITFDLCVSANDNTNPFVGDIAVRSSVDNFASDLPAGTGSLSLDAGQQSESGVGGTLSLLAQSQPVEFRFYFFDNQASQFSTVSLTDITLMATPVPEPSAWLDIALSLGALPLFSRRLSKITLSRRKSAGARS
jgi:hypothetical protein